MRNEPQDPLKEALSRLRHAPRRGVDLEPDSAFDALLEQRIFSLERQLDELKTRINGLIFTLAGAVLLQIVLAFLR